MSQSERLELILNHQEPDRVPIYLNGMPIYSDFYQEFLLRQDDLMDKYTEDEHNILLTPCGDFTINAFFGTDIVFRGCHVEFPKEQWLGSDGRLIDHGIRIGNYEVGRRVTYTGRLERIDLLPNGFPYMWYEGGYLRTEKEILNWFDRYGWFQDQKVFGFRLEDLLRTNAEFQRSILVLPHYSLGLYENTWFMMGQDRFAYFMRKNPDILLKIINSIKELHLRQIEMMRPLRPLAVMSADDMGQKGRSLLSPKAHHKFFFEARKEIFNAIHAIGAKAIMHSCGNIVELLPDLISAGIDGWQTLEPASEIDNNQLKQAYGNRLTFWGAVDNNLLCFGTPQSIENHVTKVLQQLGPGGGFIIGPAHDYLNTKVDLALAMRDAITHHGYYSLK